MAFKKGHNLANGRPKGSGNKAKVELAKKIVVSGLTPLEYLISIYQDETADRHERMQAAKDALPYIHKKMPQETTLSGDKQNPVSLTIITTKGKS